MNRFAVAWIVAALSVVRLLSAEPKAAVLEAWSKAGAEFSHELPRFDNARWEYEEERAWRLGRPEYSFYRIASDRKLPDPGVPFVLDVGRLDANGANATLDFESPWAMDLRSSICTLDALKVLAKSKTLDRLRLEEWEHLDAELEIVRNFPSLHTLDLTKCKVSKVALTHLKSSRTLKRLVLRDAKIESGGLEALAGIAGLAGLDLHSAQFDGRELTHLVKLTALETLDLSAWELEPEQLAILAECKSLRTIDLNCDKLDRKSLSMIAGLAKLEKLGIHSNCSVDELKALRKHPTLRRVALRGANMDDRAIEILQTLPKLEDLDVSGIELGEDGIRALAKITNLNRLKLSQVQCTERNFDLLAKQGQLHTLWTALAADGGRPKSLEDVVHLRIPGSIDSRPAGWKHFASCKSLRTIDLAMRTLESKDFERIAEFAQLESISLNQAEYQQQWIEKLEPLKHLNFLDLTFVGGFNNGVYVDLINDWLLKRLAKQGQLHALMAVKAKYNFRPKVARDAHSIELYKNIISSKGLAALQSLPNLRSVSLTNCYRVDDLCLRELSKIEQLKSIELDGDFGEVGILALTRMKSLEHLKLDCGGDDIYLGPITMKKLCRMPRLRSLSFSTVVVKIDCEEYLAKMTQLQHFEYEDSILGREFFDALSKLINLESLSLDSSHFSSNEDLRSLEQLKKLRRLTISLRDFDGKPFAIDDVGLASLSKLKSLVELEFITIDISPERLKALKKALPKCTITQGDQ